MAAPDRDAVLARIALDAIKGGAVEVDLLADRVTLDARARAIAGLAEGEAAVVELLDYLVHPDDRARVVDAGLAAFAGQDAGRMRASWRFTHPDGRTLALRLDGLVLAHAPTRLVAVLVDGTDAQLAEETLRRVHDRLEARVRDRTAELLWANAQLRDEAEERERVEAVQHDLMRHLATAEEDERRRIARDLHDQTGQLLVGLSLALRRVAVDAALAPTLREQLVAAQRMVDELGRQVHGLAVRLRPTVLDDLGLPAALQQLAGDWAARTGVPVDLQVVGLDAGRLPAEAETALYRVVQESLTNIAKHAAARQVSVTVHRGSGLVTAAIEDDGRGFDPALVGHDRLGVAGMRERAALAGGHLDIESSPGAGTTVLVRLAVDDAPR